MILLLSSAFAHPFGISAFEKDNFFLLGVEHIWTGYDHLLFLLALLLRVDRVRDILLIATGFTIAHSITLSAAALGWVQPVPAIVEPAIALTIALVGLENLRKPGIRSSLIVTTLLGLIHGFGFAGLLADIGIPKDNALSSLFLFNFGVEVGQMALVLLSAPLLARARTRDWWRSIVVPATSIGIAAMGVWWFVERI